MRIYFKSDNDELKENRLITDKLKTNNFSKHSTLNSQQYLGGYSAEVPPLPIPNRVVKLSNADGTAFVGE